MADEQHRLGFGRIVPEDLDWPSLLKLEGEPLEAHYLRHEVGCRPVLHTPGPDRRHRRSDAAGPRHGDLRSRLRHGRLLPRVRQADPPGAPAGPDQRAHFKSGLFTGWEIVDNKARQCAMNLLLHGIESPDSDSPIHVDDALRAHPGTWFDMVLTNPPFGKKSSVTIIGEDGRADRESLVVVRDDFWASTSNKQLNFLQHVVSVLKTDGRAAVVVPDNVLFEGGAGERIRRRLLHECDVHTLLRLPTGIFYAQGVKANVLFFDRKPGSETPWTKELWVYDLCTNIHVTLKTNPLTRADLDDFVAAYQPDARHRRVETERFKRFTYDELVARDKASLDVFWLTDDSLEDVDSLPPPAVLAAEIVEDLEAALADFAELARSLQGDGDQPG
jgi:type I restriction enzyme M protein